MVGVSYATVAEYEARYGEVADRALLQECLDDCTAVIQAELDRRGVDYANPSDTFADRLMRVCRSMANRVMPTGGEGDADVPVGITAMTATAGPYSRTYSFAATYGTPKMLPSEMTLLGIGARIGTGKLAG